MSSELAPRIETLARWMVKSNHIVVFTGAGISTESGLPDFRGPDGIWTLMAKGIPPKVVPFASAQPNPGHIAILRLQELGKLGFLVSQNVDNLHRRSGIRPDLLAELHGNVTKLRCERCEGEVDSFPDLHSCPWCGGRLKSSVVDFGQQLPAAALAHSYDHTVQCDLFVVAGSSLVVTPAADMPRLALEAGARLVIINQGETPLDHLAQFRFWESVSRVLPPVVDRVAQLLEASV